MIVVICGGCRLMRFVTFNLPEYFPKESAEKSQHGHNVLHKL